jgi:hypothetical protein
MFAEFSAGTLLGSLIATFFGFLLNQQWQRAKDKAQRLGEYIVALRSTAKELQFYASKFEQLAEQISKASNAIATNQLPIFPSYTYYPSFLEKCKVGLNQFFRDPGLVYEVGHCHFELGHITKRLDVWRDGFAGITVSDPHTNRVMQFNTQGFRSLVVANVPVFKALAARLETQAELGEQELKRLKRFLPQLSEDQDQET